MYKLQIESTLFCPKSSPSKPLKTPTEWNHAILVLKICPLGDVSDTFQSLACYNNVVWIVIWQ